MKEASDSADGVVGVAVDGVAGDAELMAERLCNSARSVQIRVRSSWLAGGAHVQISNITAGYDLGEDLLKGATLQLEPGQHVCLVGPSGSGKSTLLKVAVRKERV